MMFHSGVEMHMLLYVCEVSPTCGSQETTQVTRLVWQVLCVIVNILKLLCNLVFILTEKSSCVTLLKHSIVDFCHVHFLPFFVFSRQSHFLAWMNRLNESFWKWRLYSPDCQSTCISLCATVLGLPLPFFSLFLKQGLRSYSPGRPG